MSQDNTYALVADIGGTNTRVALADSTIVRKDTIKRYQNAAYPGLADVLHTYLCEIGGAEPVATCVAVAGPVSNGTAAMTNFDWTMNLQTLRDATRAGTVDILNDLQAQGHSVGYLSADMLHPVLHGKPPAPHASSLVVNVGTGFNASPVFDTPGARVVPPSECGHVTLPTRTAEHERLSAYVGHEHGFPSVEDVLSGRGLVNVFRFVGSEMGTSGDLSAQDIMSACAAGDEQARNTVRLCVEILGGVTGNLALTHLPFGGIYLVGGVARAFAPFLTDFGFGEAFRDKGRFASFMDDFAVNVVTDDYAALTGCAAHMARTVAT
ncbi:MAG: ROK family protein [Pseudomonadota bacterium]